MLTLFYSPHAQSIDNVARRASGHADPSLTEEGRRIAKELGYHYAPETIHVVFCSDLERAHSTAEIAFAGRSVPIIRDDRLRECDYGDMTQFPVDQIDEQFVAHLIEPFPGGQSVLMVVEQVGEFLSQVLSEHDGRSVVVIGHRATKHALDYWASGESLEDLVSAPWEWREVPIWRYELDAQNLERRRASGTAGPR